MPTNYDTSTLYDTTLTYDGMSGAVAVVVAGNRAHTLRGYGRQHQPNGYGREHAARGIGRQNQEP